MIGPQSDCHCMLQPTHYGPLPQPLLPATQSFLHWSWAFIDITIQPFEQLFTTWIAYNVLECLFLQCLHPHPSPSSSMLSPATMGLYNSNMRSIVRLIYLCSFLGSSGKSACQVCPPTYLPHCPDPFLPPQLALSVSP
jgi:hypothetical protein